MFVSVWILTFQVLGVLGVCLSSVEENHHSNPGLVSKSCTPNYGHVEDSDDELRWTFFCGGPYFQTPILVLCISFCSVLPRLQHLQNWRNHTPTCDKAWQDANFLGSEKPWSSRLWTPRILGVSFLGVDVYPHVLKSWGPIKTRIVVSSRGQLELTSGEMGKWFLTINPDSKIHSRCSKIEVQETTISVFLSNSIHDGVANFAPSWDFLGSWGTDSWPSPILW